MISFSSILAGVCLTFQIGTLPIRENKKRLSRSATLDGGCVISDNGMTDADRTFIFLISQASPTSLDDLWALFLTESLIHLSCPEGVFSGYLEKVKIEGSDADVSFLVYEKLT
jgi:hypothetical protein